MELDLNFRPRCNLTEWRSSSNGMRPRRRQILANTASFEEATSASYDAFSMTIADQIIRLTKADFC